MHEKEIISSFNRLLSNFKNIDRYKNISVNILNDINNIPLSTRESLQEFKISDCPIRPETINTTSGSTGNNTFIFYSNAANKNIVQRCVKLLGLINAQKDEVVLNLFEYGLSHSGRVMELAALNYGLTMIPFGVPTSSKKDITLNAIIKFKPSIIISTVSTINYLFYNSSMDLSGVKIICAGSMLDERFREVIETSTNAKIHNTYGSNEIGALGIETLQSNKKLELMEDGLFIEVLANEGKFVECGEGDIVITDFFNFSMPIIRYKLGDKVRISCINGVKYVEILGRSDSYTNINDSVFSVSLITKLCNAILGHDKFIVIIDRALSAGEDRVIIKISREENDEVMKKIIQLYNQHGLYPTVIQTSMEFQMTPSGKFVNLLDKRKLMLNDRKLNW